MDDSGMYWLLATVGEANTLLRRWDAAIDYYTRAVASVSAGKRDIQQLSSTLNNFKILYNAMTSSAARVEREKLQRSMSVRGRIKSVHAAVRMRRRSNSESCSSTTTSRRDLGKQLTMEGSIDSPSRTLSPSTTGSTGRASPPVGDDTLAPGELRQKRLAALLVSSDESLKKASGAGVIGVNESLRIRRISSYADENDGERTLIDREELITITKLVEEGRRRRRSSVAMGIDRPNVHTSLALFHAQLEGSTAADKAATAVDVQEKEREAADAEGATKESTTPPIKRLELNHDLEPTFDSASPQVSLLSPHSREEMSWWRRQDVTVGEIVVHSKRGRGWVIAISPDDDGRIHVAFTVNGEPDIHRYNEHSWWKMAGKGMVRRIEAIFRLPEVIVFLSAVPRVAMAPAVDFEKQFTIEFEKLLTEKNAGIAYTMLGCCADIVFAETCIGLGISVVVFLPTPFDCERSSVCNLPAAWQERYHEIHDAADDVIVCNDMAVREQQLSRYIWFLCECGTHLGWFMCCFSLDPPWN